MDETEALRAGQAQTDQLLAVLLAKVQATELALAAVIASHPDPNQALAIWDRTHLDWADQAFDAGTFPGYREQMAASLDSWSRGFRAAADLG